MKTPEELFEEWWGHDDISPERQIAIKLAYLAGLRAGLLMGAEIAGTYKNYHAKAMADQARHFAACEHHKERAVTGIDISEAIRAKAEEIKP